MLYRRTEDDGRESAIEHPLFDVLRLRPNPVQSVVAFWEAMVTALLLRGNAYAMLTRDDDGRVRALWFLNPDRVTVDVTRTGQAPVQGRHGRPDADGGRRAACSTSAGR